MDRSAPSHGVHVCALVLLFALVPWLPGLVAPTAVGAAGDRAGPRGAFASAGPSGYHDPCDRPDGALDIRFLELSDLYEANRTTVTTDPVVVRFDLCGPAPSSGDLTLRVDLHRRVTGANGSDYDEKPTRVLVVQRQAAVWTWKLRDATALGSPVVASGQAAPRTEGGAVVAVNAGVPSSEIAAAGAAPRAGDLPAIAVRACSADVDCGPAYTSDVSGRAIQQGSPDPAIDYLPDATLLPLTYPSVCQVAGANASARRAAVTPNDPWFSTSGPGAPTGQWGLRRIGAERAWDVTTGSAAVRVAVLDSGFDGRHPDLIGRAVLGRDFLPGRVDLDRPLDVGQDTDLGGHGTFVSSVIAASSNDGVGMAGTSWQTSLLVARVLDAEGCASDSAIANAMAWAVAQGATTLNLSLGGPTEGPELLAAGLSAVAAGVIPIAAAGNTGGTGLEYPAAYAPFLSVGATAYAADGAADAPASYTTRNAEVDLAAPGGSGQRSTPSRDVLGACWQGPTVGRGYCREAGTSFASPLVAGALALIAAIDPERTVDGRRELLADTAFDVTLGTASPGRDDATGAGRIDVGSAVTWLGSRLATLDHIAATTPTAASVAASQAAFAADRATTAVLARNDVFADALAGSALAQDRGPILLTGATSLAAAVRDELVRVLPAGARVYLLGGTKALSPQVEQSVRDAGFVPVRLSGPSRIETAVAVAHEVGGASGRVLIASAANWPDAISGGAYAAATGTPLLLSWPDDADAARSPGVLDAIAALAPSEVVILGGPAALSAQVEADLARSWPTRRVNGSSRFATAVAVAKQLWGRTTGTDGDPVLFVNGDRSDGWAYGLAAAPLGAVRGAPLLLVNDGLTTGDPAAALRTTWGYRIWTPAEGTFLGPITNGSDDAVSAFTLRRLRELLGG